MRLRTRDDLFDSMLATEEEDDSPEDEEIERDEAEEEEDPDEEESEWDTSVDDSQRIDHFRDDE
jgi:hypothetical protein